MRLDWRRVGALLALPLLGAALYGASLRYGPVWDDHTFIEAQAFLQQRANLAVVLDPRYFVRVLRVRGSARPAWLASVLLDGILSKPTFAVHRAWSIVWHSWAAGALMVFCAALGGDAPAALAAGAFFLLHPSHVEAVEIVTFRTDLLAAFFMLVSLTLYIRAREEKGRRALALTAGCLAAYAAALLSKEMALVTPGLAVALDAAFPAKRWSGRRRWGLLALMAALALAYLGFRGPRSGYGMAGDGDSLTQLMAEHPGWFKPFSEEPIPPMPVSAGWGRPARATAPWLKEYHERPSVRVRTFAQLFVDDARLLLWPARLQGVYDPRPAESWLDARVLAGLSLLLLVAAGAWALRRRSPLASFGLAWMLLALLPVAGVVELPNLLAERYLVVPSAGLALALGAAFSSLYKKRARRAPALAAAGVLALLAAARVGRRLRDFRDDEAFHQATLRQDPDSPRAHAALARAFALHNRLDEAREQYRQALALQPITRKL